MSQRSDGRGSRGPNGKYTAVRVLMFDLDGTLIDSRLDLAHSVNATLRHMGRAELSHEAIYKLVGSGAATEGFVPVTISETGRVAFPAIRLSKA